MLEKWPCIFFWGLLILIVILCANMIIARKRLRIKSVAEQKINQKIKPIILWDIHGVLFKKNIWYWIYLILTYPKLLPALFKMDWTTISLFFKYFASKLKLISTDVVSQEIINASLKNGNTDLVNLIAKIACEYQPDHETISILRTLKKHNFVQHAGSNIGPYVFDIFSKQYLDVFNLFSYIFMAQIDQTGKVYKKPHKNFFKLYLQMTKLSPHEIIFIDDKPENVVSAQKCGLRAILYHNAPQLIHDLKAIGIEVL